MARESHLIRERIDQMILDTSILTADHVTYIKDTIIKSLRDVFSRDPDYTYIVDHDNGILPDFDNPNLGIVITDVYSYETAFIPAITVRVDGGQLVPVSFNQNQFTLDYQRDRDGNLIRDAAGNLIPVWQEFSGLYDTNATIAIHTFSPLSREELVSRVTILFQHVLRDQLYADFGFFVKGVSFGGEQEAEYRNDNIYSQAVNLSILTSWNNRLPPGDPIESINFQIIGDAVQGEPRFGPCVQTHGLPTKKDLEESNRVDFVIEIRNCPDLFLEDALEFNEDPGDPYGGQFILAQDWYEILTINCGVTIEDAITQVNMDSSLRERLLRAADELRQKAAVKRNNKTAGKPSGIPGSLKYKFPDGTIVLADNTVIFPNDVEVTAGGDVTLKVTGIVIDSGNNITVPSDDYNLDFGANPFTATTLEGLDAFQFFLILLFVDSPVRQSTFGLNKLIDEFVATLTDPTEVSIIEDVRTQINEISEARFVLNKIITFDRPGFK